MTSAADLLRATTPTSKSALFRRLGDIISIGWAPMPVDNLRYNGTGGPGNFLEDLIGLQAGNQDIADIIGWEVKYYTKQTNLITLFHKEPQPEGVMRYMVSKYGWRDAQGRQSFRHTIAGKSDRFQVVDDARNIIVRPRASNGVVPTWSHDTLLNIAGGKLRRLLLVKGEKNGRNVRYLDVDAYEDLHLSMFLLELCSGTVCIDFDVREMRPGSKALRNHGTKFRVAPDHVCRLYRKKERLG